MQRVVKRVFYAYAALLVGCAEIMGQAMKFPPGSGENSGAWTLPGGWTSSETLSLSDNYFEISFLRNGETRLNWTEAVSYSNLADATPNSLRAYVDKEKAQVDRLCPGAVWRVIGEQESEILYEYRVANCSSNPNGPDEDRISRVIFGKRHIFRVFYAAKVKDLPQSRREEAIKLISKFHVTKSLRRDASTTEVIL